MTMVAVGQPMAALERANEVRVGRAQLKRDLHAQRVSLTEAFESEFAQGMSVGVLLAAQRQWGRVKARKVCQRVPCLESRLVRDLTVRQRMVLEELAR